MQGRGALKLFAITVVAPLAAVLAMGGFAKPVHAQYPELGPTGSLGASSSTLGRGAPCSLTFTLVDPTGTPVSGAGVSFSASGLNLSSTSATTGSGGQASVACTAGSQCGTATATGTSQGATAQTQVQVVCPASARSQAPLTGAPATGGQPGGFIGDGRLIIALIVAACLAAVGGTGYIVARRRRVNA